MQFKSAFKNALVSIAANKAAMKDQDKKFAASMLFLAALVFALMPSAAMAAPWDGAAQAVLDIFTGGLTRTLAIIAVIACGIAAIAGKLSWDWAIKIIVGIVLIFGAAAIVDFMIAAAG